ncbi:MAG: universal stress protein [Chlamydiia bacterium]|nr:universal stress protein [Chlamydiia bacterium]
MQNHSEQRVVRLDKRSLKRVLGAWDLFAVGYGDVGSSIYYALGATALFALGATPLALLVAGLVFICTALTYAEMAATFPEPGGSATYSRHAFNDLVSFIAGWGLLLDYVVTIAISAFAIPPYMKHLLAILGITYTHTVFVNCAASIGIVIFLFFLNFFGVRHSGRLSLVLALFTIITQVGIILMGGLLFLNLPYIFDHMRIAVTGADWSPDWWNFAKGCAMAMVAYTGIEAISQLAAETKNPARSIPKAIKWTTVVILFLYIGLSTVGFSILTPQELGTRYLEDPIGGIAQSFPIGGQILGPWVGLLAAIILLIAANAGLIGCSRLIFSMGESYQVPSFCYKIHSKFHTPYVTLLIFSILPAIVIVVSRGRMIFLADLYNFGAQMAFFFVHLSLLVLRWKRPDLERPYKAPFNIPFGKKRFLPLTAIIGVIASFSVWLLVVFTKPEGRIAGLSWMILGITMYLYYRKQVRLPSVGQLRIEKIKIPEYKPIRIANILTVTRLNASTESLQTAFQLAYLHKAKVSVVYILEVPYALPMDSAMPKREQMAEAALKRAEAISREFHVSADLQLIRSRSVDAALLRLVERGEFDLVVLGAEHKEMRRPGGFAAQAEKFFKDSNCRVLLCRS